MSVRHCFVVVSRWLFPKRWEWARVDASGYVPDGNARWIFVEQGYYEWRRVPN